MDYIIYFFYQYGLYILLALALAKVVVIFWYKGFDILYIIENFLIIYTTLGIEYNPQRKRFRIMHNTITIAFYFLAVAWVAIAAILRISR